MNVRAKEEHGHTYASSINTSTNVIATGINLWTCDAGQLGGEYIVKRAVNKRANQTFN